MPGVVGAINQTNFSCTSRDMIIMVNIPARTRRKKWKIRRGGEKAALGGKRR